MGISPLEIPLSNFPTHRKYHSLKFTGNVTPSEMALPSTHSKHHSLEEAVQLPLPSVTDCEFELSIDLFQDSAVVSVLKPKFFHQCLISFLTSQSIKFDISPVF